jgi:hypothetical protein
LQYNLISSTKQGLVEDVLYHCGLPVATGSYNAYSLADITRNINNAYQEVATLIWRSDGSWQYDDSNATDSPIAYITLGQASASYIIPTTALRIEGIEVKDSSSNWVKLTQLDYQELNGLSPEEYFSVAGTPREYDLVGNEIRLFPPPTSASVTLASGMMVRLSRNVTLFTTASTTAEPGFASPFHKILSYAAAIDFVQDKATQDRLVAMKTRMEAGLVSFYGHRNKEKGARIKPRRNIYRYR